MSDESGEYKIAEILRHPFGLFKVLVQMFSALGLGLIFLLILFPLAAEATGMELTVASAIGLILAVAFLVLGLALIAITIRAYKGNRLIITNQKATQIVQVSLFDQKVVELPWKEVADVNSRQKGWLADLFNYGILEIKPSKGKKSLVFKYCPRPAEQIDKINEARESRNASKN